MGPDLASFFAKLFLFNWRVSGSRRGKRVTLAEQRDLLMCLSSLMTLLPSMIVENFSGISK